MMQIIISCNPAIICKFNFNSRMLWEIKKTLLLYNRCHIWDSVALRGISFCQFMSFFYILYFSFWCTNKVLSLSNYWIFFSSNSIYYSGNKKQWLCILHIVSPLINKIRAPCCIWCQGLWDSFTHWDKTGIRDVKRCSVSSHALDCSTVDHIVSAGFPCFCHHEGNGGRRLVNSPCVGMQPWGSSHICGPIWGNVQSLRRGLSLKPSKKPKYTLRGQIHWFSGDL